MTVTLNYDTVIDTLTFDLSGVDAYPRFTGSVATEYQIKNNDIVELENIPCQFIISNVGEQNSIYYGTLTQYMGFNPLFAQNHTFQAGTRYQTIISYVFNDYAFFLYPVVGEVDAEFTITAGSLRWEVLGGLAQTFGFTVEWNQVQNIYFIRPFETSPCRDVSDRGFIKLSTKTMYNHINVHNKNNECVDVYTEDYFKVGRLSMNPVEVTTSTDRFNMIQMAQMLLKKERQNRQIITGVFDTADYGNAVNEIGRLWNWDNVIYRIRTVKIMNGALVVVGGQEDDNMIMFNLNEREDLRGLPSIWV